MTKTKPKFNRDDPVRCHKRCAQCKKLKSIRVFPKRVSRGRQCLSKYCNTCNKIREREAAEKIEQFNQLNSKRLKRNKWCLRCETVTSHYFGPNKRGTIVDKGCIICLKSNAVERRRELKIMLIGLAGGECINCGFKDHPGALQFHHRDPSRKVAGIAELSKLAHILEEIKECDLLCANCHAIECCEGELVNAA